MPQVNVKSVAKLYRKAIFYYPTNADAHSEYVDWIHEGSDDESNNKNYRKTYDDLLLPAMQAWADGVSDEIEP